MEFSTFGQNLGSKTGIGELMTDLGQAMTVSPDMLMMGGGNPAHIPEMQAVWQRQMKALLNEPATFDAMLANYDPPNGNPDFHEALADFLNAHCGWNIRPTNLCICNGGQTGLFLLLNMLAGQMPDGSHRKVVLPLCPEYIGYADQGLARPMFRSFKPEIEEVAPHRFKYHIDFNSLELGSDTGAICVSRPTNPTGNVLTDEEVRRLSAMAGAQNVPLIIDNAYGAPFPNILFNPVVPVWNENMILTLSLSKLGLPGTRTGIVVGSEELIQTLMNVNAVTGLSNGNIGQALVKPLLRTGELKQLCDDVVRPFYQQKSNQALAWVDEYFPDELDYAVHVSEGALFLWFWFRGLPISDYELYERLKAKNVLVVPGSYFFYGLDDSEWPHSRECIRVTYSQADDVVQRGLEIISEEVTSVLSGH